VPADKLINISQRQATRQIGGADSAKQVVYMAMTFAVLADVAASVSDLKRDPMGTIRAGAGETVVILNRNEPAFYAVPPARYEAMLELIDDIQLAEIVRARRGEPSVRVNIDDLIADAGGAGKA
jgi:antitoxin StbD